MIKQWFKNFNRPKYHIEERHTYEGTPFYYVYRVMSGDKKILGIYCPDLPWTPKNLHWSYGIIFAHVFKSIESAESAIQVAIWKSALKIKYERQRDIKSKFKRIIKVPPWGNK